MTESIRQVKNRYPKACLQCLFCIILSIIMIYYSHDMKIGVTRGLALSVNKILPTLFPFFILSDVWDSLYVINENSIFCRIFSKVFHLNSSGIYAFIVGGVCGFPLGVKSAVDSYDRGKISLDEMITLCGFCNNPSAAFVISGIGLGLFSNIKIGILLYLFVIISAIVTGFMFRPSRQYSSYQPVISKQSFSIVQSIKKAADTSITVCSFITFFSAVIYLLKIFIKSDITISFISPLIEISSAVEIITGSQLFSKKISMFLIGFALGFSGLSVHLQALCLMPKNANASKYFLMKIIQGLICACLCLMI